MGLILNPGNQSRSYPESAYIQSIIPPLHRDTVDKPWWGVITRDRWKYVCFENQDWLLFNLNDDPYEQMNLAHNPRYKIQRDKLRTETARWVRKTGDTFPVPVSGE